MRNLSCSIAEIESLLRRLAPEGYTETQVPNLILMRASNPATPIRRSYEPTIYLIVCGQKVVTFGSSTRVLQPGDFLISNPDLHFKSEIGSATVNNPYLGIALKLDPSTVSSILGDLDYGDEQVENAQPLQGASFGIASPEIVDAFTRATSLLDRPADIRVIAPLIERELVYRIATEGAGSAIRHMALGGGRYSQMARAIAWIRHHYKDKFHVEDVADAVGLSALSLHRYFRRATSMSPLQYQKRLRLQEARRLLIAEIDDAAMVSVMVGYESASQFSREYKRFFGRPPMQDIINLRSSS